MGWLFKICTLFPKARIPRLFSWRNGIVLGADVMEAAGLDIS
jgi:hypothetical protein